MDSEKNGQQSGMDAISARLKKQYPGQEELYYGTIIPYGMGGNDPLDGVGIWKSEEGIPHWHYVTYGFTEIYEKECDNPEVSGFGFELTFRLKRGSETEAPIWPISLLQNLARYVFSTGNVFGAGHHMSCNGPIALETDTKLTALAFQVDPELGELDTPNGNMVFLQAIGITGDELEALMCWDTKKFLDQMEKKIPLCISDLERDSLMEDPAFHEVWQRGMEEDGSSTGFFYLDNLKSGLEKGRASLQIGAGNVKTLLNMLRARLGKERSLYLQSEEAAVSLQPGQPSTAKMEDDVLSLTISEKMLEELSGVLKPHTGHYELEQGPLTVEVVPTRITDQEGNLLRVIE